ncbi:hypothetical protein [Sutterella sp.]|uniref:hypothetical protein n=1 Tax=Sutterella sp. TaxID=1981025 RepID=UPI0026DF2A21|nr:hypothetical protein [Sutterella sp.]MDO5531892.1 hypothetical protein [Sutterella sp.]
MTEANDKPRKLLETAGEVEEYLYADPELTEERFWSELFIDSMRDPEVFRSSYGIIRKRAEEGDAPSCRFAAMKEAEFSEALYPVSHVCARPGLHDPLSGEMRDWLCRREYILRLDRIAVEKAGDPDDKFEYLSDLGQCVMCLARMLSCRQESRYDELRDGLKRLLGEYEEGRARYLGDITPQSRGIIENLDGQLRAALDGKSPGEV